MFDERWKKHQKDTAQYSDNRTPLISPHPPFPLVLQFCGKEANETATEQSCSQNCHDQLYAHCSAYHWQRVVEEMTDEGIPIHWNNFFSVQETLCSYFDDEAKPERGRWRTKQIWRNLYPVLLPVSKVTTTSQKRTALLSLEPVRSVPVWEYPWGNGVFF